MNKNEVLLTAIIPFIDQSEFLMESISWRRDCDDWQEKVQIVLIFDNRNLAESDRKELRQAFKKFEHVEIVEGDFGGPGNSRNQGLARAIGDWIVFWDSDDLPSPKVLIDIIDNDYNQKFDYIVTEYNTFCRDYTKHDQLHYLSKPNRSNSGLWHKDGLGIWRIIFKREKLTNCLFPSLYMGEDAIFFIRFLNSHQSGIYQDRPTYSYQLNRKHQLTANKEIKSRDSFKAFLLATQEVDYDISHEDRVVVGSLYARLLLAAVKYSGCRQKSRALMVFIIKAVSARGPKSAFLINALLIEIWDKLIRSAKRS